MAHVEHCLAEAQSRARACYAEGGRHYHDLRHLEECEQGLKSVPDLSDGERRLLQWALLWHDAVYDPAQTDNEERSAALARRELTACGVDDAEVEEVTRLILLTKGHRVGANDRLGAVLVSIDLSILGSSADRYEEYARDVRKEYAHVPDHAWREGRSAVLRALMSGPVFAEPRIRAALEDQARINMERELRALGSAG